MRRSNLIAAILGIVILVSVLGYAIITYGNQGLASRNSQSETTSRSFQQILDTLPGGGAQLAMLSYNFQLNGSFGTLFMVFKNYSNSSIAFSSILFDQSTVANSSMSVRNCYDLQPSAECDVTLNFGTASLKTPSANSNHTVVVLLGSGSQFDFPVTVGQMEEAGCTFTSTC